MGGGARAGGEQGGGAASASGSWLGPGGPRCSCRNRHRRDAERRWGPGGGAARRSVAGGGRTRPSLLQDGAPVLLIARGRIPPLVTSWGAEPALVASRRASSHLASAADGREEERCPSPPQLGPWGPSLLSHPCPTLLGVPLPRPAFRSLWRRNLCGAPRVAATQRQLLCCLAELWGPGRALGLRSPPVSVLSRQRPGRSSPTRQRGWARRRGLRALLSLLSCGSAERVPTCSCD